MLGVQNNFRKITEFILNIFLPACWDNLCLGSNTIKKIMCNHQCFSGITMTHQTNMCTIKLVSSNYSTVDIQLYTSLACGAMDII